MLNYVYYITKGDFNSHSLLYILNHGIKKLKWKNAQKITKIGFLEFAFVMGDSPFGEQSLFLYLHSS